MDNIYASLPDLNISRTILTKLLSSTSLVQHHPISSIVPTHFPTPDGNVSQRDVLVLPDAEGQSAEIMSEVWHEMKLTDIALQAMQFKHPTSETGNIVFLDSDQIEPPSRR